MKPELKKLLILNAPYLLFVYLFDKIGQAVRLAPGADLSGKVLSLADGFSAAFATPLPSLAPILNEFISRIEVHERDKKRAKQAIQHIGIYFNHIGRFENELTQLAEPTEQEIRQMRGKSKKQERKRAAPTTATIQENTGREILKRGGSTTVSKRGNIGRRKRRRLPPHCPHHKTE